MISGISINYKHWIMNFIYLKTLLISVIIGFMPFMARSEDSASFFIWTEITTQTDHFKEWKEGDEILIEPVVSEFSFSDTGFCLWIKNAGESYDQLIEAVNTEDFDNYTAKVVPGDEKILFHLQTGDITIKLQKYGDITLIYEDPYWEGLTQNYIPSIGAYEINLEAVKKIGAELYKYRKISQSDYNIIKNWK